MDERDLKFTTSGVIDFTPQEIKIDYTQQIIDLLKICKERNELNLLFDFTKIIAETDSIGEQYSYCKSYTYLKFEEEINHIESNNELPKWGAYISEASIFIYKRYLQTLK